MRSRSVLVVGLVIGTLWSPRMLAQRGGPPPEPPTPRSDVKVQMVQTVGCVQRRSGEPATWWLTRAQEPKIARAGVFNSAQIDEVKKAAAPGAREFHLIGVADFLDAEGLLHSGTRAQFTNPDQVNATGELREGHVVLVKGLLIDAGAESRINLLTVVGIADTCQ